MYKGDRTKDTMITTYYTLGMGIVVLVVSLDSLFSSLKFERKFNVVTNTVNNLRIKVNDLTITVGRLEHQRDLSKKR
jgi:hypothetical protein